MILRDNWYYLIIVLVSNTLYFSSDFLPERTEEFKQAKKVYSNSIDSVTSALDIVKIEAQGTLSMNKYEKAKKIKEIEKQKYYDFKNSLIFFSFNDFWQFLYEFGKSFPYLLLLLFLEFWFLTREKINKGIVLLIASFLCLSLFKMYWIFQPLPDVSKVIYFLIALLTSTLVCHGMFYISKYRKGAIKKLQTENDKLEEIREKLIIHTILHSNPEKKQEILDYIESALK
ncbi:hypothetical protein PL373_14395 [Tenacibaculum maritimum]|nr:hypothetical protein [Tenacibaculum maritimum]MDB0602308.1 hypothetical protein [Tenacibaculum maritimum]MDB0612444.1 hypothetical protein [Tenacibaculum maritimum]